MDQFVSKVGGSLTYRLKTLKDVHTCGETYKGTMATSKWVASKLADTMKTNQKISFSGVIKEIKNDYYANVYVNKAYQATKMQRSSWSVALQNIMVSFGITVKR